VFTPCLSGLGTRAHLFSPAVNLQTHVDDVIALVKEERLRNIVLVGHSYAGLVISGAADSLRDRVSHYIYLDAAVPEEMRPGASMRWSDFNTPAERTARLKTARDFGNGAGLPAPPAAAFGVTDPADAAWLEQHMRPMPLPAYTDAFVFANSGSAGMRRTYIAASRPPYASLAPIRERLRGDPTWSFTTIDSGHDAMLTAPAALGSLLLLP